MNILKRGLERIRRIFYPKGRGKRTEHVEVWVGDKKLVSSDEYLQIDKENGKWYDAYGVPIYDKDEEK